jgi:hypothetical protein
MPRKKYSDATSGLTRSHHARLLYLSRNPDFRQDLKQLEQLRREHRGNVLSLTRLVTPEAGRLASKWELGWDDIVLVAAEFNPPPPVPVFAWVPGAPAGLEQGAKESSPELRRFLHLRVDLQYPADLLVPLVERAVRAGAQTYPRGRSRHDRVDFHLKIFDRANNNETFTEIAAALRRKLSTVKSAYLVASRNIFGSQGGPSKRGAPLAGFDYESHCQRCPICIKAETGQQMCGKARAYARFGRLRGG